MSLTTDGRFARATPPDLQLALTGRPVDARLPLAMLEAVKAVDTPAAELDADFVHELRNKRLGLSETVLQQIRRYGEAARARQRIPFDEVLALSRLIGRRPDADLVFREAGRRWARALVDGVSGARRGAARHMPALMGRPIALGILKRLAKRHFDGDLSRQGSALVLEVTAPVTADAGSRGAGCGLYEAAFRETLHLLAGADEAVDHVACRSRGDARCQWRSEWRRR